LLSNSLAYTRCSSEISFLPARGRRLETYAAFCEDGSDPQPISSHKPHQTTVQFEAKSRISLDSSVRFRAQWMAGSQRIAVEKAAITGVPRGEVVGPYTRCTITPQALFPPCWTSAHVTRTEIGDLATFWREEMNVG
jgi:hypothetical protein